MILYIRKTSNFEQVENFLLNQPDKEYKTSRFVYYFKQVEDGQAFIELIGRG